MPTPNRSFLSRYHSGEYEQVWTDLLALGESVRAPQYLDDALEVAREAMRRVRKNVELVHRRLLEIGYQFHRPERAHIPPNDATHFLLLEIESTIGLLPLSLRAFYEEVGSVDFTQSMEQLVSYDAPRRPHASELQILGEEDPLYVARLDELYKEAVGGSTPLYFCFAPDEFHKAYYSGGENYHVWLPDAKADFYIEGMYDIKESFVAYLRASFRWGGFRGRVTVEEERAIKIAPNLELVKQLADGLLSF